MEVGARKGNAKVERRHRKSMTNGMMQIQIDGMHWS